MTVPRATHSPAQVSHLQLRQTVHGRDTRRWVQWDWISRLGGWWPQTGVEIQALPDSNPSC